PAYAPVGYHSATGANPEEEGELESGKTLILAAGFGWLYGLGCVIGPFYGVGVGLTFPGGVLAGAGGGVGIVIGIGAGAGGVWGSGRGSVLGYSVSPPMNPPFSSLIASAWGLGRSRSWLAGEPPEVELRLRAAVTGFRRSSINGLTPSLALSAQAPPAFLAVDNQPNTNAQQAEMGAILRADACGSDNLRAAATLIQRERERNRMSRRQLLLSVSTRKTWQKVIQNATEDKLQLCIEKEHVATNAVKATAEVAIEKARVEGEDNIPRQLHERRQQQEDEQKSVAKLQTLLHFMDRNPYPAIQNIIMKPLSLLMPKPMEFTQREPPLQLQQQQLLMLQQPHSVAAATATGMPQLQLAQPQAMPQLQQPQPHDMPQLQQPQLQAMP
ncbi:MAG: hypothetical protein SGPRY_002013, partial [Prymnesium sp.]